MSDPERQHNGAPHRHVLYLDAATNNRAQTAFSFFITSVQLHGLPSRVRADQGVENLDIAHFMFATRGTGRSSFISGKSTMTFFTLWKRMVYLTYLMPLFSLVCTTSLSLDSGQILIPLLKDGIIILCGQSEVSPLNSCGSWDVYKIWTRGRDSRTFRTQALTGRVLCCRKTLMAQLWFLNLSAHWMMKPWKNFRELSTLWSTQSHMVVTYTSGSCNRCPTNRHLDKNLKVNKYSSTVTKMIEAFLTNKSKRTLYKRECV
ncbi:uncharacterized protein LOC127534547 [Acanthochromis polyacanthus]|uniref:uncharacterized protein LOC127534547 n=1 Tax=Acanthochromis polyacanthus TaxID=80966 RepID=UPI0022341EFB|nr:uncharacterized protein LOC127534547 [Acanthochromis polyacanthus]